ncbi:MAG: 50S ribosomal protein L3 [Candidatus Omnitrophica bacterium]|nr:50S ribosomal protein L3 [Candidatus Omnitrophota bacterium]
MIRGLLGKKIGMTQIFNKEGNVIPVTVIEVGPCTVLELKDSPKKKVTVGFEAVKEDKVKKPQLGFFKKLGISPMKTIQEFTSTDNSGYQVGGQITADVFKPGDYVDVIGTSIGKGFQGGIKRWHWVGGPATHGSMHHRRIGSIGASSDPSKVLPGQNMPGHMGDVRRTVQGLRVMDVNLENNLIMVNGPVPGTKNAKVTVVKSFKKTWKSLEEQKVEHVHKKNPMKQSKAKVAGKAK